MKNADYFERQVWAGGLGLGQLLDWYAYLAVLTSIRSEFGIRCKGPVRWSSSIPTGVYTRARNVREPDKQRVRPAKI